MMRSYATGQDSGIRASMVFDAVGAGAAISGVAQAAGAVTSAGIQADAIKTASRLQTDSANRSADLVQGRYVQSRGDFEPYRNVGLVGSDQLAGRLDELTSTVNPYGDALNAETPTVPKAMTQDELANTPGYQFTLSQGLKAAQSSAAARGLGVSGAAMRGAADYATGLSDQTYNTRFNQQQALFGDQQARFGDVQSQFTNYQGLQANAYNRLLGTTSLGENAAAQTGSLGNAAANQAGNYLTSGANSAGAAMVAGGNAISSGINGAVNAYSQASALNALKTQDGGMYAKNVTADGTPSNSDSNAYNTERGY